MHKEPFVKGSWSPWMGNQTAEFVYDSAILRAFQNDAFKSVFAKSQGGLLARTA